MPVPTETLHNTKKVSFWFAFASVSLLASLIWMIKVDYARPWREIQNEYVELQAELARFELMGMKTEESLNRLEAAKRRLAKEEKELEAYQTRVEELLTGLEEAPQAHAGKLLEEITGGRTDAYLKRAREIDLEFAEALERQIEDPDTEALRQTFESDRTYVAHFEDLLSWFHLASLRELEVAIRGDYEEKNILQKNLKSQLGPAKIHYEHALALHGPEAEETQARKAELAELKERFEEARLAYDQLSDQRKAIEDQIDALRQGVEEADRDLLAIQKEFDDAERKYADLSNKVKHGIFNLPLMDFAAPKGTPGRNEVKQVVLPDVRVDLNFVESYQTDRCMTCHVAIDNKDFTKENISRRLEDAIEAINEKLQREKKPVRLELPVVEGRDDLLPGEVTEGWLSLTASQPDALF